MSDIILFFIEKLKMPLKIQCNAYNIDPKILAQQIQLETGWLQHIIPNSKNLFNIKWKGGDEEQKIFLEHNIQIGKTSIKTHEYIDGKKVLEKQWFRTYNTFEDSIKDYILFVVGRTNGKILDYKKEPQKWYECLIEHKYQTDPDYIIKCMNIYQRISDRWI